MLQTNQVTSKGRTMKGLGFDTGPMYASNEEFVIKRKQLENPTVLGEDDESIIVHSLIFILL